ncbi:MAG: hypothetical protein J6T13_07020 [Bacteroidales bacterium]|nr:hypothetical protein [Bacteroidales bacterium]
MKRHRINVLLMLVFSTIEGLLAQSADTMYVVKRHVVRDTVYVRDTVRVQDTIIIADYIHSEEFKRLFYELNGADAQTPPDSLQKMWAQTVTILENRVIQYEQQNVSTMDSIKKYGLAGLLLLGLNSLAPAQTEAPLPVSAPKTKTQSVLHDSPFNGFHFGYTLEADIVHPVEMTSMSTGKKTFSSVRYGGRLGLECSYHFADYFGVSAALDIGCISLGTGTIGGYFGLSMPLKFEFHYPVADKLWITANAGVQLRMPLETFSDGYDKNEGVSIPNYHLDFGDPVEYIRYLSYRYNRSVFYADIMADVGLYYQLPNKNYLRLLLGLDIATTDFANGNVLFTTNDGTSPTDGQYSTENQYVSQRNHYLYFQLAYLHSFSKHRAIKQAQPHWNDGKTLSRHEFRLGVSDPLGFTYLRELFGSTILGEPIDGISPTKQIFTPVFSLDYHYRASKWFWLGLTTGYNLYEEKGYGEPEHLTWQNKEHHFLIMPSLRFSYLNRPHLTLYSGLSVGLYIKHGREYIDDDLLIRPITTDHNRVFSAFQLTAFGLKAGAKHWFGSFEAGFGIKGFANLGVGYEF